MFSNIPPPRVYRPKGGTLVFGTTKFGTMKNMNSATSRNSNSHSRRLLLSIAGVACIASLLGPGGCAKPLLSPNEPRSQYDRYDAIRAQRSPSFEYDEFGRKRPNLRGRLIEKQ
jgi:hypothetical protein